MYRKLAFYRNSINELSTSAPHFCGAVEMKTVKKRRALSVNCLNKSFSCWKVRLRARCSRRIHNRTIVCITFLKCCTIQPNSSQWGSFDSLYTGNTEKLEERQPPSSNFSSSEDDIFDDRMEVIWKRWLASHETDAFSPSSCSSSTNNSFPEKINSVPDILVPIGGPDFSIKLGLTTIIETYLCTVLF